MAFNNLFDTFHGHDSTPAALRADGTKSAIKIVTTPLDHSM
jgi:hypothetical protein